MSGYCRRCGATMQEDQSSFPCPRCDAENSFTIDSRIGQVVAGGQYRVLSRVGAGGFGIVYEVETVVGGLRRALKVLNRDWLKDEDMRQRFINEALVLEEINHPNVARCYAAGTLEPENELYLLFELIDGAPLRELIGTGTGDRAGLNPARAVRLAKQVAAGLKAAHDSAVLHRDLKPDNIIVKKHGTDAERACVVDFGIALLMEQGSAFGTTVDGTPEYMSPEQFLPGAEQTVRSDLWQLGAVLFAMLTGSAPYASRGSGGSMRIMAMQRARTDLGPAPSEKNERIANLGALDTLVARLLATDPAKRPASAEEVCEELARIEHTLATTDRFGRTEPLLAVLSSDPSEAAWLALLGYIGGKKTGRASVVAKAEGYLAAWPDALRRAPTMLWESSKHSSPDPMWPLVRALDLARRGLRDRDMEAIAQSAGLANITHLELQENNITDAGLEVLLRSPHVRGLIHLNVSGNRLGPKAMESLARAELRSLRTLIIANNAIGAAGARSLEASQLALVELDVSSNTIGAEGIEALAAAKCLGGLRRLNVSSNRLGDEGLATIARSENFAHVSVLEAANNHVGPRGMEMLAKGTALRSIRALRVSDNPVGADGVDALFGAGYLESLERLDLSGTDLGALGAMALAGAPFLRYVRDLELGNNQLGDTGLAALLGSPQPMAVRSLGLSNNGLTPTGATLFGDVHPSLDHLNLSDNPLRDAGAAALAPVLEQAEIRTLRVDGCELTSDGIARMVESTQLRSLVASRCPIGPTGISAILQSAGLTTVEELTLGQCHLGPSALLAFTRSPNLVGLRVLRLPSNNLGDDGITALVASAARLPRLEVLDLDDNDLTAESVETLSASPLATRLTELSLGHNNLGDLGAEVIAHATSWQSLRTLSLEANGIGLSGAAALTTSPRLPVVQRMNLAKNALSNVDDMHSLSKQRVAVLESSFARLTGSGIDIAARFYEELFRRYPTVKPLFANANMARQRGHLMGALVMVIDNLRQPERVEKALTELGTRHRGYGVVPGYYEAVCSTLLGVITEALGSDADEEVLEAWNDGLEAIANVMLRAAEKISATA